MSSSPSAERGTPKEQALQERGDNRSQRPTSQAFRDFIARSWQEVAEPLPTTSPAAPYATRRREVIGQLFPGERLVIPAGTLQVRSNDTDYRFRPHSAFAHLTGLGTDQEPDAVLVMHPVAETAGQDGPTHEAVLYFRPRAGKDTEEFYADSRYGELWVGRRPSLEEIAAQTGLTTAHIDSLGDELAKDAGSGGVQLRVVAQTDASVTAEVEAARSGQQETAAADAVLTEALSELRLRKDDYEIAQLREAVAATVTGFEDIVTALPRAITHRRGERVIEGVFGARAREEGNAVGYETIAAAGNNANTLHWIRNDGEVRPGDLVLIDAGVEVDSLYTADITRTIPVDGTFTSAQRQVYEAVLDAADAAFAKAAEPGVRFRELHEAAMWVLSHRLEEWGLLPGTAEESLAPEGQFHRRWMVHGTSHHLGIDVHDCAQARREMYLDATLETGMVFTIEPGLYFRADDLAVPPELRGTAVRIEDDVLVTEDGVENLSAALPRRPEDVEAWMADLLGRG